MSSLSSVLTQSDVEYILSLPEVQIAKDKIDLKERGSAYFTIELTNNIRTTLQTRFGLDFSNISNIPMRWIKGDSFPHIDGAVSNFEKTYLIYLNDNPGQFLIGDESYSITQNTGFIFNEGTYHSTTNTGSVPRLLLGPMNEFAEPVGYCISYYPTQYDAENNLNIISPTYTYTISMQGGFTSWRIANTSSGSSDPNSVYNVGDTLVNDGVYNLYPNTTCFLEGTTILCQVNGIEKYVPIESIQKGMFVKTSRDGYKIVQIIGRSKLKNPGNDLRIKDRLYKCSTTKYPSLTSDLYITGYHSILEFPITEKQKEDSIKELGKLYVTDKKYRIMAYIDERAEPWNSEGVYNIYHFALENKDESMNYGVYANGGLLVESCALKNLQRRSNMTLI